MPSGYCSDCTRTYVIGAPPAGLRRVLPGAARTPRRRPAPRSGPGSAPRRSTPRRASRSPRPGYGEHFIHRTGHGIGLETPRGSRTSWPGTPSRWSRAWRSPSSRASTPARTAPGSRTSWSAPSDGCRPAQQRHPGARGGRRLMSPAHRVYADEQTQGRSSSSPPSSPTRSCARPPPRPSGTGRSRASCSALLGAAGLLGLPYPEQLGGGGQPYEVYLQVVEELAGAGWPSGSGVSVHTLTCFPLAVAGHRRAAGALAAGHARRRPARRVLPVRAAAAARTPPRCAPGRRRTAATT